MLLTHEGAVHQRGGEERKQRECGDEDRDARSFVLRAERCGVTEASGGPELTCGSTTRRLMMELPTLAVEPSSDTRPTNIIVIKKTPSQSSLGQNPSTAPDTRETGAGAAAAGEASEAASSVRHHGVTLSLVRLVRADSARTQEQSSYTDTASARVRAPQPAWHGEKYRVRPSMEHVGLNSTSPQPHAALQSAARSATSSRGQARKPNTTSAEVPRMPVRTAQPASTFARNLTLQIRMSTERYY